MTREQKIAAIYQEMANKKLTLGCKVKFSKWIYSIIDRENVWFLSSYKGQDWDIHNTIVIEDGVNSRCYSIEEIIWHPVMIGDVMQYLEDKSQSQIVEHEDDEDKDWFYSREAYYEDVAEISDCWRDKRLSIDEQSDECIDYIYSLIGK